MRIWFAIGMVFAFARADHVDPLTDKDHFKVSCLIVLFSHSHRCSSVLNVDRIPLLQFLIFHSPKI